MNARDKNGIVVVQGSRYAEKQLAFLPCGNLAGLLQRLLDELHRRRESDGVVRDDERDNHFNPSTLEIDPFQPSDCGGA